MRKEIILKREKFESRTGSVMKISYKKLKGMMSNPKEVKWKLRTKI